MESNVPHIRVIGINARGYDGINCTMPPYLHDFKKWGSISGMSAYCVYG